MIGGDTATHQQLESLYHAVFSRPIAELEQPQMRICRFFFDVIHAAQTSAEQLGLLATLPPHLLTPLLLDRLAQLWQATLADTLNWQQWVALLQNQLSQAHDLYTTQLLQHIEIIEEQRAWIEELNRAKEWLAEDRDRWQAVAEALKKPSGQKSS